jgi:glucose-1-phosphate adenylyltransferase
LPSTIVEGASLENVSLADGCWIGKAEIQNSVIGLRSQVRDNAHVCDTVLMGADYFDSSKVASSEGIPLGIGEDSHIEGAIIDKNARIGRGAVIRPFPQGTDIENGIWVVRDGIVVIPKNTTIPDGMIIGPK